MKLLMILGLLAVAPMAFSQSGGNLELGVYAVFDTTQGEFTVQLYNDLAPKTVQNFIALTTGAQEWRHPTTDEVFQETPYYDGIIFHRIIENFMIQGGDPSGTGTGGPGYRFEDEFHPDARHSRAGILSMANAGPDTNGSQFFITLGPTPHLDNIHSVFGEVVEGMDIIMKIGDVDTGARDKPVEDVVMNKVTIQQVERVD